jgi:hypothetical protein
VKLRRLKIVTDVQNTLDVIEHLTPKQDEVLCYLTGPHLGRLRVLSRIVPLREFAKQSPVRVRPSRHANFDAFMWMLERGLKCHAHAHSHPGFGPCSTTPSSVDLETLSGLQRGLKADVIGMIVVRPDKDGISYVRFFSPDVPFHAVIVGKAVNQIDENLFAIQTTLGASGAQTNGDSQRHESEELKA